MFTFPVGVKFYPTDGTSIGSTQGRHSGTVIINGDANLNLADDEDGTAAGRLRELLSTYRTRSSTPMNRLTGRPDPRSTLCAAMVTRCGPVICTVTLARIAGRGCCWQCPSTGQHSAACRPGAGAGWTCRKPTVACGKWTGPLSTRVLTPRHSGIISRPRHYLSIKLIAPSQLAFSALILKSNHGTSCQKTS